MRCAECHFFDRYTAPMSNRGRCEILTCSCGDSIRVEESFCCAKFVHRDSRLRTAENCEKLPVEQRAKVCSCGKPAVKVLCDDCLCDEIFNATKSL